ncbi:hypothetical protein EOL70_15735, partial [Leucothrix sargassi]
MLKSFSAVGRRVVSPCIVAILGTFVSTDIFAASIPNSVCNAETPSSAWGDIAVRWEHNANGGSSTAASIDNNDIFQSAGDETVVGITAQVNAYDLNINSTTVPTTLDPTKYIQYTFTTNSLLIGSAELTGITFAQFENGEVWHNQSSGTYQVRIEVDDDPSFGSPSVLSEQITVDPVDTSQADVVHGPQDNGLLYYRMPHYDADAAITLAPNTTYTMRVYPYNVTATGQDPGSPYGSNVVLWDDIMLKGVTCGPAPVVNLLDYSDAPSSYGDVSHTVVPSIQLGAAVTTDAAAYNDPNAAADDDDGVTLPAFKQGETATIQVAVNQLLPASLYLQ